MNYVGKLLSNFKGFYSEINSATLTGAIDTVVVEQDDGSFVCSPFHVRFGKMGVLRSREKRVEITVNGTPVDLHMKLGDSGEAFFVQECDEQSEFPDNLATSPLPSVEELMQQGIADLHKQSNRREARDRASTSGTDHTTGSSNIDNESDFYLPPPVIEGAGVRERTESERSSTSTLPSRKNSDTPPVAADASSTTRRTRTESERVGANEIGAASLKRSYSTPELNDASFKPIETEESYSGRDGSAVLVSKPLAISPKHIPLTSSSDCGVARRETTTNEDDAAATKKKKKKKGSLKKRHKARQNSSATDSSSAASHVVNTATDAEIIFNMDDDEDGSSDAAAAAAVNAIPRTTSLPIIEENRMEMTNDWARTQFAAQFHPFSDGDITPIVSPVGSRPPSPKSDTEVECKKIESDPSGQEQDDVKWMWGELPEIDRNNKTKESATEMKKTEVENAGGLFHFMRKTKKLRHQPEQEGIYLEDLKLDEMDPEVAALYLYNPKSSVVSHPQHVDEDNESGRGASLPQSPVSVEGTTSIELSHKSSLEDSGEHLSDMKMSICGGLKEHEGEFPSERFMQGLITYDDFCQNPGILTNPDLVIKLADKYYNWQVAGPIVMSVLAFQKPLPEHIINDLLKQHMPKKEKPRRGVSSWFYWRRASTDDVVQHAPIKEKDSSGPSPILSPISSPSSSNQGSPQRLKPHRALRQVKEDDESTSSEAETDASEIIITSPASNQTKSLYRKSVRLTSDQLKKLNLNEGMNEVTFSVTTALQGTTRCSAYIFRWRFDDRVIISDIDGTITKSDVLGQILPMVGKDWSQGGVAHLYTRIHGNGYKFLYLSARAIGQSTITRDYLRSIRQGELSLPLGPLLLSPSSLISAFHKEVIERKPEEFKIGCLRDVQALFPASRNPFYAGFGNKINDTWAYRAVGLPMTRIFTINHRGELRHELTHTFQSSYWSLSDVTDHFFPPLHHSKTSGEKEPTGDFHASDEFSTFTYWREPIPELTIDLEPFADDDTNAASK